jgi:beta-phosphoglucomutase-like phosphatase (HAD superfamily)
MKIFISHSIIDQQLAEGMQLLISRTSNGMIETYLSSSTNGLGPGDVIWNGLHNNLTTADKIITIITPNSILKPWLTYESGFVAGKKGETVIPLLFCIEKKDLPLPLAAYTLYSGDNVDELKKLIIQMIKLVAPNPDDEGIYIKAQEFLNQNHSFILDLAKIKKQNDSRNIVNSFYDKLTASEILHQKLKDETVTSIKIITYTNEVEVMSLNHYRIKGKKDIEVYKRSILKDYREQQITNLRRLKAKSGKIYWDKLLKSVEASIAVRNEAKHFSNFTIQEYLYDSPPLKRAYIFDDKEALFSFYTSSDNPLEIDGSVYKGMGESNVLFVNTDSKIGSYIIEELLENVKTLKLNSRSFEYEARLLTDPHLITRDINAPCLGPKAIFLDLDGILYNSLPNYEIAWKAGFDSVGIPIKPEEIHLNEGRSSVSTVRNIFMKNLGRNPTKEEITQIIEKKNLILKGLKKSEIMDGAKELIIKIKTLELPLYIVTGSTQENIKDRILLDFPEVIDKKHIINGEDVKYGKPNPEPYLLACQYAELSPAEVLVIENAPLGIRSANEAGSFCIGVNTGILSDEELINAGAHIVFDNCVELAANWEDIISILKLPEVLFKQLNEI